MSDDEIRNNKVEMKTPEGLNLANLTQDNVNQHGKDQTAAAQHELTAEDHKNIKEIAKDPEHAKILMRCPVAGKVLANMDKEKGDKNSTT